MASTQIKNLFDVCMYLGAEPGDLSDTLYKDTDCGAWLTVDLDGDRDRLQPLDLREHMIRRDATVVRLRKEGPDQTITGITIGTIVEGSDACPESERLTFPFTAGAMRRAVARLEAEATRMWEAANLDHFCVEPRDPRDRRFAMVVGGDFRHVAGKRFLPREKARVIATIASWREAVGTGSFRDEEARVIPGFIVTYQASDVGEV